MITNSETPGAENTMQTASTTHETTHANNIPAHVPPPAKNSAGAAKAVILLVIVLLVAIGLNLHSRHSNATALTRTTAEAAVLNVTAVHPTAGSQAGELVLPGNVRAFSETPIYSRTNGYLKKWYFDIGARVRKGQLLAEIETPEVDQQLNQSRAELQRMEANEKLAETTSNRWQSLATKHAVSLQEVDQARSNYLAEQAAVDASRADVRRLELLQSYERIVAPFDGVITARNTDVGDLINAGSGSNNPRELFHLAATGTLRIYVSVPELDSDAIRDGDTATITEDANPALQIAGKIVRNANAIDTSTRTLNVEVDIDNSRNLLRPGAYVFVHFHLPPSHSAVVIPANGLLFRKEGLRAALVKGDRVQMMPVTIGHDFGNTVEITSGLGPTDEVILDPPDSLTDGAPVRAQLKGGQQ